MSSSSPHHINFINTTTTTTPIHIPSSTFIITSNNRPITATQQHLMTCIPEQFKNEIEQQIDNVIQQDYGMND